MRKLTSAILLTAVLALAGCQRSHDITQHGIIQDATQCCAQGIEFVPLEDYTYPDDFPEIGENICVTGVFDTYKIGRASCRERV